MKTKLTVAGAALALALACAGTAQACDDHHGTCEIEEWILNDSPMGVGIDGVATCDEGRMALRIYEGEGGKLLGVDNAFIKGHIFKAMFLGMKKPKDLALKYSIEQ